MGETSEVATSYKAPGVDVKITTFDSGIESRRHFVDGNRITTTTEFKPGSDGFGLTRRIETEFGFEGMLGKIQAMKAEMEKKGEMPNDQKEAGAMLFEATLSASNYFGEINEHAKQIITDILKPSSFITDYQDWKKSQEYGHGLNFWEWRKQVKEAKNKTRRIQIKYF